MLEDWPEAHIVALGLRSRPGLGSREVGAGPGQVVLGPFDPPGEHVSLRDRAGKCSAGSGRLGSQEAAPAGRRWTSAGALIPRFRGRRQTLAELSG